MTQKLEGSVRAVLNEADIDIGGTVQWLEDKNDDIIKFRQDFSRLGRFFRKVKATGDRKAMQLVEAAYQKLDDAALAVEDVYEYFAQKAGEE